MSREPLSLRACDRCHVLKERCKWTIDSSRCDRCHRLKFDCGIQRRAGKPGRRPQYSNSPRTTPASEAGCLQSLSWSLADESDGVSNSEMQREMDQVRSIFFNDALLEIFLVGPSFCESMREQTIPLIVTSKSTVRRALLAFTTSWAEPATTPSSQHRPSNSFRHAASALRTMTSLRVTDYATMADCITIGAFVLTFALKWRVSDLLAISRQTLLLIKPIYESEVMDRHPPLDFLTCLITEDICGSMLQSRMPVLRPRITSHKHVDRYNGPSITFLPILYDICELNHAWQQSEHSPTASRNPELLASLTSTDKVTKAWRPTVPDDFLARFSTTEVTHMLCQAQVLPLAAQILLHRMQHPYGTRDEEPKVLSRAILTHLDMARLITSRPVKSVDLAILVALFDVEPDQRQKWMDMMPALFGYSSEYQEAAQQAVVAVWGAIESQGTVPWSALATLGPVFWQSQI